MHALAGAHAAPHAWHTPSTGRVHSLYARAAGSYMHRSAGAHAGPKWTHAPVPLPMHVKYVPVPGCRTQLGAGQPRSGATAVAVAGGDVPGGRTGFAPGGSTGVAGRVTGADVWGPGPVTRAAVPPPHAAAHASHATETAEIVGDSRALTAQL